MNKPWRKYWSDRPVATKLMTGVVFTVLMIFLSNLLLYTQINTLIMRLNQVYSSNVNLTELSDSLSEVQGYLYRYLEIRDYDSLSGYYRASDAYRALYEQFPEKASSNPIRVREKNIRYMSEQFLKTADSAVLAKRGMNIERYKEFYSEAMRLYDFIGNDITILNEQQFQSNSASYLALQRALQYMEVISLAILAVVFLIALVIMLQVTGRIVAPLRNLAELARAVGGGDFSRKAPDPGSEDEVGVVTRTFNNMVDSLNGYVVRMRESAEKEQELIERELMTQNHLKEAQLRFLQAQINPHFLFNSLNAGVQLAEMEDDEKTAVFLERMADFFRYNVKKGTEDAAIGEELETVENYIYILNVRFSGEIGFETEIERDALSYRMPSMILQPIVENAVNHGIRSMESGGRIHLSIRKADDRIRILVRDNGKGMTKEQIERILSKGATPHEDDSTGIGMDNVIARLALYYGEENLLEIFSDGPGTGTTVALNLPQVNPNGRGASQEESEGA